MRVKIPPADIPPIDPQTGKWTPVYYDIIKGLEKLGLLDLADVSTTAPTNGQVITWDSTNKVWKPNAN